MRWLQLISGQKVMVLKMYFRWDYVKYQGPQQKKNVLFFPSFVHVWHRLTLWMSFSHCRDKIRERWLLLFHLAANMQTLKSHIFTRTPCGYSTKFFSRQDSRIGYLLIISFLIISSQIDLQRRGTHQKLTKLTMG